MQGLRIVTWNMKQKVLLAWNYLLETLQPDIALVQESVIPKYGADGYRVEWHPSPAGGWGRISRNGLSDTYEVLWTKAWPKKGWGSAILSRVGELRPVWQDSSRGAVAVANSSVSGLGSIAITSLHARVMKKDVHGKPKPRVIPGLRKTFSLMRPRLRNRFIVGGDFNTARAAGLAWPDNGHREFWNALDASIFRDCYYILHGAERQTFWRSVANETHLMDDHILVDAETIMFAADCFVCDNDDVRQLSDHGPVVADLLLPDENG